LPLRSKRFNNSRRNDCLTLAVAFLDATNHPSLIAASCSICSIMGGGNEGASIMRRTLVLIAATMISAAPTVALTKPAAGSISPAHTTGQQVPPRECEDFGEDAAPSQSGREPGPGSPFQEDSISGSHYAGEQDGINNKNTASVSQYDIACSKGPDTL
jgi:hypothetical protein